VTTTALSPTGDQFELTRGGSRAVITQVAAALREFSVDGVHLTEPYSDSVTPPFGDGIVLAPWPNRVRDGKWVLDGQTLQLDITEPARDNALHGLLRVAPYLVVERTESSITLAATVYPQHGYPFRVATTVTYELVDGGLRVIHTATNESGAPAPVAFGTHPFFRIGDVPTEEVTLTLHAGTRFDVDDRLNPLAEVPVDGDFDLRGGRLVAELELDTAFGGLAPVDRVVATLTAPDGRRVSLWQDENHGYSQVFTTRSFPKDGGLGLAVAVEPMTAPPDALNSGLGLKWLEPGETWSVEWGIQYAG
jgi:aldose 1-epimerase